MNKPTSWRDKRVVLRLHSPGLVTVGSWSLTKKIQGRLWKRIWFSQVLYNTKPLWSSYDVQSEHKLLLTN